MRRVRVAGVPVRGLGVGAFREGGKMSEREIVKAEIAETLDALRLARSRRAAHKSAIAFHCRPWLETPEETESINRFYGIA